MEGAQSQIRISAILPTIRLPNLASAPDSAIATAKPCGTIVSLNLDEDVECSSRILETKPSFRPNAQSITNFLIEKCLCKRKAISADDRSDDKGDPESWLRLPHLLVNCATTHILYLAVHELRCGKAKSCFILAQCGRNDEGERRSKRSIEGA